MTPWLNLLYRLWHETDPDEGGLAFKDTGKGLIEVAEETGKFDSWFHEHVEESPLIIT
jgi:hypothetical protein